MPNTFEPRMGWNPPAQPEPTAAGGEDPAAARSPLARGVAAWDLLPPDVAPVRHRDDSRDMEQDRT